MNYSEILNEGIALYDAHEQSTILTMFKHGLLIAQIGRAGDSDSAYYNATMKYANDMEKSGCPKSRTYWLNCIKCIRVFTEEQRAILVSRGIPSQYVVALLSGVYDRKRDKILKMVDAGLDIKKQLEHRPPKRKYIPAVRPGNIIETDKVNIDPGFVDGIQVIKNGDVNLDALETHLRALVSRVGKEVLITTLNSIPERSSKYADLKI